MQIRKILLFRLPSYHYRALVLQRKDDPIIQRLPVIGVIICIANQSCGIIN
jgi:hypothetical protein